MPSIIEVMVASYSEIGPGFLTVDGIVHVTLHTFSWTAGSLHTPVASSLVSCGAGCRCVFVQWSDGTTTTTYAYTTPSKGPVSITAIHKMQYQITISALLMETPMLAVYAPSPSSLKDQLYPTLLPRNN
jgi:hypothetical protein